jgi:hemolysin III
MKRPNYSFSAEAMRPSWRGRLHAIGALASLPAGAQLALFARGAAAVWASVVFSVAMTTVYVVSASYHVLARTKTSQAVMRRLDHAAIYLLIAGTYTPLCIAGLPPHIGTPLLVAVWIGAMFGVALKTSARADRLARALYMVLGWAAVVAIPVMWGRIDSSSVALIASGGVIYTLGAVAFAVKWPRLKPEVFGYHEVWHSATLVAGGLHFAAVMQLVG